MKEITLFSRANYKHKVRRDKRRATSKMTKTGRMTFNPSKNHKNSDRTGDWKTWWRQGCGVLLDGKSSCPPGHAYFVERYRRAEHRATKIAGRRKERRQNKRIDFDE